MCRERQNILHFSCHTLAVVFVSGSLAAVFQSHNLSRPSPKPNLYSAHSLVGLSVSVLLFAQYIAAFGLYWWPRAGAQVRKASAVLHGSTGTCVYMLALATILVRLWQS